MYTHGPNLSPYSLNTRSFLFKSQMPENWFSLYVTPIVQYLLLLRRFLY